jgi:hypothetical protein
MQLGSQFGTIPEFHYYLDSSLSKPDNVPVIVMPMFLNCPPEEISTIASGRKISCAVEFLTEDIFKFRIGLRKRSAKGFLVNYDSYWCGFLIPNQRDNTATEVASRWMQDMFPIITPSYVTSRQMLDLVENLSLVEKSSTVLLDYVARSAKEGETTKRWKSGKFSKERVMKQARNDDSLVDALRIDFSTPNFSSKFKLNRRGLLTIYEGSFSEVHRLLISGLVLKARANLTKMANRKRVFQDGETMVDPLRIKPEVDLTNADMKQLEDALSEHYMTAVLYGGNPWLLISLLDKSDGSALDLQAYHDEIIITPVTRVSAASLTRLYSVLEEVLPSSLLQIV